MKKAFCMVLSILCVCSLSVALAATPKVVIDTRADASWIDEMTKELVNIANAGMPAVLFFGDDTARSLAEIIDPGKAKVTDIVPVAVENYSSKADSGSGTFKFETSYKYGSRVAVVVGTMEGPWLVASANVTKSGEIEVVFSPEQLALMNEQPCCIAVLTDSVK